MAEIDRAKKRAISILIGHERCELVGELTGLSVDPVIGNRKSEIGNLRAIGNRMVFRLPITDYPIADCRLQQSAVSAYR